MMTSATSVSICDDITRKLNQVEFMIDNADTINARRLLAECEINLTRHRSLLPTQIYEGIYNALRQMLSITINSNISPSSESFSAPRIQSGMYDCLVLTASCLYLVAFSLDSNPAVDLSTSILYTFGMEL